MSGMLLKTCWAFNERWNNKFYYKVTYCWLFLLSHTTMPWSMNIKPELSLCVFVGVLFTFNQYSEFLASLVICIHAIVGPWRMDFESFFWLCLQQIIFYVTLLVKYRCHFVVSLVHHHHHHHVQEGLGLIPVPCILKMKLVPPSLPRSSYVSSSFWFIL